ncbi:MAG TPA: L,D-transpeptidase/peptidoglycan binding protein [Nitriliruptorales bacterium]|nr:L,D-transpeptidase/peptidoglycan binding protein [Nitriliruptorales bacterium]
MTHGVCEGMGATSTTWIGSPDARRLRRRVMMGLALAIVVLLGGGGIAVARDMQAYRQRWDGRALPGAVVNGVDLTGMTEEQAVAAVDATLAPQLDRPVTVRFEDRTWTTSLRGLGAATDAPQVVARVFAASQVVSWRTLAEIRWRGATVPSTGTAGVHTPEASARDLVRAIAEELHIPPVDAELRWTADQLFIEPERPGRGVAIAPTVEHLLTALDGRSDTAEVVTEQLSAQVTAAAYDQVLFLRQEDHQLDLYLGGRLARSYPVATGTGDYPTPTGVYHVSLKRPKPVWVNPDPSGWGRGMPKRIEAGPNNPLGLRALNWSAPGAIRFHGTANIDSLGRDASHGCVRLSNDAIVELFDLVDVGAHIVSIR